MKPIGTTENEQRYATTELTEGDSKWAARRVRFWANTHGVRDWDADELVQEVLLQLVADRIAARWDPDRGASFRGFLARAIEHSITDCLRRRLGRGKRGPASRVLDRAMYSEQTDEPVSFEDLLPHHTDPTAPIEIDELKSQLLNGLDDRSRQIVLMRWRGLTNKQVAKRLGVCESRITQLMHGIRQQANEPN